MTTRSEDTKTVWTLEMTDPTQLRAKHVGVEGLEVRRVEIPSPGFSWFLHQAVGADYRWGGRETWSEAEWRTCVGQPGFETWVAYVTGAPAGYFEFGKLDDGSIRIHSLGLLKAFFGRGLGAHLLTTAVEIAWKRAPRRVWLNTCSHDHPHALDNYRARGFRVVNEQQYEPNAPRDSLLFGGQGAAEAR